MWCVYEVCVVNLTGSRSFATAPMNPIEHTLTDRVLFGFGQKATETETCCWVCEKVLVSVQGKHAVISSALPVSTKRAPACATSACFFKARRISSPHLMHEAARSSPGRALAGGLPPECTDEAKPRAAQGSAPLRSEGSAHGHGQGQGFFWDIALLGLFGYLWCLELGASLRGTRLSQSTGKFLGSKA